MSLVARPDGLHADVPNEIYHERILGMVSKGALEQVAHSPMHYKAWIDGLIEPESTPALAFGSAFHCALLEPDRFGRDYVVAPDFGDCRLKANKASRDAWRTEHKGATPIAAEDGERIRGMVRAVHAHELAGKMVRDGEAELTALWQDAATGLRCRARADYYVRKHGMLVDAKSTIDASPKAFARASFNLRYHWQAAHYTSGFAEADAYVRHFVFIAVEKAPPYALGVYSLDVRGLEVGYRAIRAHMATLAECMQTNTWPGYAGGIQTIETPHWAD